MYDLKNNTSEVTSKAERGPVVIMNRATPQGVFVSPTQWNALVELIDNLRDSLASVQAELEIATGKDTVETITDPEAFLNEVMGHETPVSA
ncbi:type II toxin-antitoxin system Phd/YefM family antitoxin [Chloroflexi bacterium TSY]|nr:type II toxin-antitoxin system Phd/YefM family antitoxin [Chloroflexi bacterium TSY]